ncbi:MAG TPA: VWA domain-containing protein [Thermoanaerobaculia bacterium]|nr:VWA domain-containing protein [Thermoanaerobaculia bacterium]
MSPLYRALSYTILVLFVLPASAQQASPADTEPFGEVIDVRVVNVEVVVTDRDGNRVSDLKPGDFRLKVDGKDVPIDFFTEVRDRQAVAAPAEGEPVAGPASVAPGEPVGTSYLVFIDDYFTIPPRRNEVLKALAADLPRLGPQDRMAIVSFDGARLTRLSGWTSSAGELGQALDKAASVPARGIDRITELRSYLQSEQLLSDVIDQPGGNTVSTGATQLDPINQRALNVGLSQQQVTYGKTLAGQIEIGVSAVVSAMRGAGSPPGRKVLLLLAGSWPFSIQSFLAGDGLVSSSRQLPDGEQLLRPLTSTANLLGYTIYPVDVPGVETEAASADSFGSSGMDRVAREQENHGTLEFLAKETGGRPLFNTSRTAVLETAEADTRSYYWLGFTPSWQRNDKRHTIEVDSLRPGLQVRARTNFLDLSRNAEVAMMVESALMLGNLPGATAMPIRLGTLERKKKGEVRIPVTLGLPVDALTVVPIDGKYTAKLELRAAAADIKGNRSLVPMVPLTLSSDKPPKPGGYVRYDTKITVHGDVSHLVVAVYDPLSGKISTAEVDVQ